MDGTPIDIDKVRSIGVMKKVTKPSVKSFTDPVTGLRGKAVQDELGNTTTEYSKVGSGVSERQDVHIQAQPVNVSTTVTS